MVNAHLLQSTDVKGSLSRHAPTWERLTSDSDILKIVRMGYEPPFAQHPCPFREKNNKSAEKEADFVLQAVMDMLHNGFAKLTKDPPKVANPFSVSIQSNGKKRLIADLRHLNKYLKPTKFKLYDLTAALPSLRQSNYLFSFDFHKAYYHIDLDPRVQKYFGFSFSYKGKTYYGYHTIAPFGLNTLPQVFTKLMKL